MRVNEHLFFLLVIFQNAVSSSPPSPHVVAPTATVPVTMAVTTTIPPGARSSSPSAPPYGSGGSAGAGGGQPNSRCCDNGRIIYTDPATGQTICSCQYDLSLSYNRLAGGIVAAGPGGGLPLGVYPEGMAAYLSGAMGADQPPFYPNPVSKISKLSYLIHKNQTMQNLSGGREYNLKWNLLRVSASHIYL